MKIYNSLTELIGKTPLLRLNKYGKNQGVKGEILAKLEYFNPLGSIKDRVAYQMIASALENKEIDNNTVIIEPTSGNTGIALASVCVCFGLKCILTMPESMSIERRQFLQALGAELVLTEAKKGMQGAMDKAVELKNQLGNAYIPNQFASKYNPLAHRKTTVKEILEDTDGKIDYFVAGIGTGGTITGIGSELKKFNSNIKIIGVEPYDSPLITQGRAGSHKIQGIGANFIPEILDLKVIDQMRTITTEQAYSTARKLATTEGFLTGVSAGAAVYIATQILKENPNKTVVAILPDTGDRYLSTNLFHD